MVVARAPLLVIWVLGSNARACSIEFTVLSAEACVVGNLDLTSRTTRGVGGEKARGRELVRCIAAALVELHICHRCSSALASELLYTTW